MKIREKMNPETLKNPKDKIYYYAKKTFYKKGFKDSKLKDIAEQADIPIAMITYYFKTKINILSEISHEFFDNINTLLDTYESLNITNHLYKKIVLSHIYYTIIFSDKNNLRLYHEAREKLVSNDTLHNNDLTQGNVMYMLYWGYVKDFNLSITKSQFEMIMAMTSAARGGFFNYYFDNHLNMEISEIVNVLESIAPRLFGIDPAVVDSYLLKAQSIIKEIDFSGIKYLI